MNKFANQFNYLYIKMISFYKIIIFCKTWINKKYALINII